MAILNRRPGFEKTRTIWRPVRRMNPWPELQLVFISVRLSFTPSHNPWSRSFAQTAESNPESNPQQAGTDAQSEKRQHDSCAWQTERPRGNPPRC